MAKRSNKSKNRPDSNSALASARLFDLPETEQMSLVLGVESSRKSAEDAINDLLGKGWKVDGRLFQTDAGTVLIFEREKKS